jgi:hypothetical protein
MTMQPPPDRRLPHHTLFAYRLCLELVGLVARTRIGDAQLRQQARKSAASAALNAAEGAARESAGDKRRSYGIASGEAVKRPQWKLPGHSAPARQRRFKQWLLWCRASVACSTRSFAEPGAPMKKPHARAAERGANPLRAAHSLERG